MKRSVLSIGDTVCLVSDTPHVKSGSTGSIISLIGGCAKILWDKPILYEDANNNLAITDTWIVPIKALKKL